MSLSVGQAEVSGLCLQAVARSARGELLGLMATYELSTLHACPSSLGKDTLVWSMPFLCTKKSKGNLKLDAGSYHGAVNGHERHRLRR